MIIGLGPVYWVGRGKIDGNRKKVKKEEKRKIDLKWLAKFSPLPKKKKSDIF